MGRDWALHVLIELLRLSCFSGRPACYRHVIAMPHHLQLFGWDESLQVMQSRAFRVVSNQTTECAGLLSEKITSGERLSGSWISVVHGDSPEG